jgi:S-DNA-T family DNA segregation ATPase FtsK/SpoIIIE
MNKRHYFGNDQSKRRYGFATIIVSLFTTISLISYSSSDACINVINNEPIINIMGKYGAIVADIIIQSLGFSSYIAVVLGFYFGFIIIYDGYLKYLLLKLISSILLLSVTSFIFGSFTKYNFKFEMLPGGYLGFFLHDRISGLIYTPIAILISLLLIPFLIYAIISNGKKSYDISNYISKALKPFVKISECFFDVWKFTNLLFTLPIKTLKFKRKKTAKVKFKKITIQKIEEKEITIPDRYNPPNIDLLTTIQNIASNDNENTFKSNMLKLSKTLGDFGIRGDIIGFKQGPVVSLYEFKPHPGIKSSRIIGLSDDIARNMMVSSVRIATITGKDTLGIEMPNKTRNLVSFKALIEASSEDNTKQIPIILGCDIFGNPIIADLTTMPHLLIAGTTGSGKSVGVNGMILSILYKLSPDKCKFIMIDPKMLEFSLYNDIPHLLMPVITEAKNAILALKWVVKEMENRYRKMSSIGVRNIYGYNSKNSNQEECMPFIVVIIDEMADLMVVAGKEVEVLVQRLSQMARAAGIHLVMATQRPSVDVITGVIKANFPTRISYQVTSKIDSRTILGEQGAEQLLGKGDMLYMQGGGKTLRVHGPFVSDTEVEKVTNYLKSNYKTNYIDLTISNEEYESLEESTQSLLDNDDIYTRAIRIVLSDKKTSISYLQRKLRIGYNKAAELIEKMENEGILSSPDNMGKRIIIASKE